MRRREFITLLGGTAAAWPLAARAQQAGKLPTIGFLGATPSFESQRVAAFVQQLRELAWVDGRNVAIEYRWAEGRPERVSEIAAEFVRIRVDVIVTVGTPPALAAKQATAIIPIVFASVSDPVGTGLVESLARPGGNVTGLSSLVPDLAGKRLEILREVLPGLRRLAIMAFWTILDSIYARARRRPCVTMFGFKCLTCSPIRVPAKAGAHSKAAPVDVGKGVAAEEHQVGVALVAPGRDPSSVVRISEHDTSEAILVPLEIGERVVERFRANPPRLPEIVFRVLHGFRADRKAALVGSQDGSRGDAQHRSLPRGKSIDSRESSDREAASRCQKRSGPWHFHLHDPVG
jgi:hypothetical protein